MKNSLILFLMLLLLSCNTQPQPLVIGKDECSYCKMPYADAKFGAEIITVKGKVYKFDDVSCMNNFTKAELRKDEIIKSMLIVNYSSNQTFLNTAETVFLISPQLHTPMNSGIAGFESKEKANSLLVNFPGEILSWHQLQQKLNGN